ncbi:FMN-binding negative transcriptional regulator [Rummeliibacillus pycnus]|uniref:FMN-binding negative transcriptional regulator n=1 Tax=Rummeliibacillus pycnus TaxID=101070 RepID=UPI003D2A6713
MFIPKNFQITDRRLLKEIMEDNSFATIISQHEGVPCATQLPLLISEDGAQISGHFARPNSQWREIENQIVLALFQGPHSYISSSWYETNQSVPTWNYVTVQAYGKVELIDGEEMLRDFQRMVKKYEAPNSGYHLEDMEKKLLDHMSKGVQAFRMHITKLEGKAKLSQNHSIERRQRVIEQLEKRNHLFDQQIANYMRRL